MYLEKFIHQTISNDERKEKLWRIIYSGDFDVLKQTIIGDQFFEEPLYHIANQASKNYDVSEIVRRLSCDTEIEKRFSLFKKTHKIVIHKHDLLL